MDIRKIIREEVDDFDWITKGFQFTENMVRELLSNCEDLQYANYNLRTDRPYLKRGKPNTYYMSMCDYWWDKFEGNEWLENRSREDTVILILNDKHTKDIRTEDVDIITMSISEIVPHLNGVGRSGGDIGEFWFFVDDNGKPKYDIIPTLYWGRIKDKYESMLTEQSEFDWIRDIKVNDGSEPIVGNVYHLTGIQYQNNVEAYVEITDVSDTEVEWMIIDTDLEVGDSREDDFQIGVKSSFPIEQFYRVMKKPSPITKLYGNASWWTYVNRENINEQDDLSWIENASAKESISGLLVDWLSTEYSRDEAERQIRESTIYYNRDKDVYRVLYDNGVSDIVQISNGNVIHKPQRIEQDDDWVILEQNDFDWIRDIEVEQLRFFDVYVCDEMEYMEDTGEDMCVGHGGSYFLRIPIEEVSEIWPDYLGVGDYGGPGDEGEGILEWMNDNVDPDDYASVEYIREISKEEFCMAVKHDNEDICY